MTPTIPVETEDVRTVSALLEQHERWQGARSRLGAGPKPAHVRPTVPCPLCGSPIHARQPLPSIRELSLGGHQAIYMDRLLGAYPGDVRSMTLIAEFWGADPDGGPNNPNNVVSVYTHTLNKKLKPLGWKITSRRAEVGSLYRLMPDE